MVVRRVDVLPRNFKPSDFLAALADTDFALLYRVLYRYDTERPVSSCIVYQYRREGLPARIGRGYLLMSSPLFSHPSSLG